VQYDTQFAANERTPKAYSLKEPRASRTLSLHFLLTYYMLRFTVR